MKVAKFGMMTFFLLLLIVTSVKADYLGAWTSNTIYPTVVQEHSCVVNSNNIFCSGGFASGGPNEISATYNVLLTNNALGTWESDTNYPTQQSEHSCIVYNNYIYCLGGTHTPTTIRSTAFSFPNSWASNTVYAYPISAKGLSCIVDLGYDYCIGGGTAVNSVYDAPISLIGYNAIGAWTATTPYPVPIMYQSCVVSSNNYVYCIGGLSGSTASNSVYSAPITNNAIGAWTANTPYPANVEGASCVFNNNQIYCIGGGQTPPSRKAHRVTPSIPLPSQITQ